jgi:hypothetical protein
VFPSDMTACPAAQYIANGFGEMKQGGSMNN